MTSDKSEKTFSDEGGITNTQWHLIQYQTQETSDSEESTWNNHYTPCEMNNSYLLWQTYTFVCYLHVDASKCKPICVRRIIQGMTRD